MASRFTSDKERLLSQSTSLSLFVVWRFLIRASRSFARAKERGILLVHSPKPKLVHYIFLLIVQFPWFPVFDGKDVPSGTIWHGAFRRVDKRVVCVQAASVAPTVGPSGFIVWIQKPKTFTQRGDDFGEPDWYLFRHQAETYVWLY